MLHWSTSILKSNLVVQHCPFNLGPSSSWVLMTCCPNIHLNSEECHLIYCPPSASVAVVQGACKVAGLTCQIFYHTFGGFRWVCLFCFQEGLRFSVHNPERRKIGDGTCRTNGGLEGWTFSFMLDFCYVLSIVPASFGSSIECLSVLQVFLTYSPFYFLSQSDPCLQMMVLFAFYSSLTGSSESV